jgi:hypothetical protein
MNVMGCLHLLRTAALREVGDFDIRYTPSQVDDLDHDLSTCLAGYQIMYCGDVTCEHHQNSGVGVKRRPGLAQMGSIIGNDLKMTYKFAEKQSELLRISQELSTLPLPGCCRPQSSSAPQRRKPPRLLPRSFSLHIAGADTLWYMPWRINWQKSIAMPVCCFPQKRRAAARALRHAGQPAHHQPQQRVTMIVGVTK